MRLYGTMDNSFYMMELNCSVKQLLTDTFLYNQLSDSQVRVCQGGNLPWPVVATWPSLYFTSWPLDSIVLRFRIWPNNTSIFTSFISISLPPAFSLCMTSRACASLQGIHYSNLICLLFVVCKYLSYEHRWQIFKLPSRPSSCGLLHLAFLRLFIRLVKFVWH